MDDIKVSVCIITYNQEDFIRECLDGAIKQTVDFNYEIVIGEDCSTDRTLQICKEYASAYPNLIKIFERPKNLGMTGNWIESIQNCNGKYIALCEGDDFWTDPLKLQKQVDFLESNPDYVMCFHAIDILKTDGSIIQDNITSVPDNYEHITTLARVGNYIHTPSVVFRNIIKQFPVEFKISPICDYLLYIMLAEQGKLKYLEQKMAIYREGVGVLSQRSLLKTFESSNKLYSCVISYLKDEGLKQLVFQKQAQNLTHYFNLINSKEHLLSGNIFYKMIKYLSKNYNKPSRIFGKLKALNK